MGILALAADERVVDVQVSEDALTVWLMDGRSISVPLAWYPRLLIATEEQRRNWKIIGGGFGIHWEEIDEDLSSEGLLRGAPAPRIPRHSPTLRAERHFNIDKKKAHGESYERSEAQSEKGILDHVTEGEEAAAELTDVVTWIGVETEKIGAKIKKHSAYLDRLIANSAKASDYKKVALLTASDMNTFSTRIEDVLPKFERSIRVLEESYSAFVSFARPESSSDVEHIGSLRGSLSLLLSEVSTVKQGVMTFRDSALSLRDQRITKELSKAATRQARSLDGITVNIEQIESFALRITFLIEEKLGAKFEGDPE